MSSRYEQAYYDEWFEVPRREGIDIACCDCLLTHRVRARVRNGKIELQFGKNARSTAALRTAAKRHPR